MDGEEQDGATCLVWKPLGSDTASPLRRGVSGRIVYKEPPPPQPPSASNPSPTASRPAATVGLLQRLFNPRNTARPVSRPMNRPMLYLRSGDTIPSDVEKIDEKGVWFVTPVSESTFVPHDKVKAVVLGPQAAATVHLTRSERDRLLTSASDAEGQPADPPAPLDERRLPPRSRDPHGQCEPARRDPSGGEGNPAQGGLADHLAPPRGTPAPHRPTPRRAIPRAEPTCRRSGATAFA